MKRIVISLLALVLTLTAAAQTKTTMPTRYREFQPSVITLSDGRVLKESLTNVFLKNSSLLYMSGGVAKEANMATISRVEFADRTYVNLDGRLAYLVDSVGTDRLYCIELFDVESYERNIRNNVNFSNITFGQDALGTTSVDLNNEEDYKMPIVPNYYYVYKGELLRARDRSLTHQLDKEQRRRYKTIISENDFSWMNPESLLKLLKAIQ